MSDFQEIHSTVELNSIQSSYGLGQPHTLMSPEIIDTIEDLESCPGGSSGYKHPSRQYRTTRTQNTVGLKKEEVLNLRTLM